MIDRRQYSRSPHTLCKNIIGSDGCCVSRMARERSQRLLEQKVLQYSPKRAKSAGVPSRAAQILRATCCAIFSQRPLPFWCLPEKCTLHAHAHELTFFFRAKMFAMRRAASRALAARSALNPQRVALRAFANKCPHDASKPFHKSPLPLDHAGGLLEYSVVYTDRAMNHMSKPFCKVRVI